jgi:hypothetical protein
MQDPKEFELREAIWMAKKINNGAIADWSVSLEGVRQLAKAIVEMEPLSELGIQYQDMLIQIDAYCMPIEKPLPKVEPSNNPDPG